MHEWNVHNKINNTHLETAKCDFFLLHAEFKGK